MMSQLLFSVQRNVVHAQFMSQRKRPWSDVYYTEDAFPVRNEGSSSSSFYCIVFVTAINRTKSVS